MFIVLTDYNERPIVVQVAHIIYIRKEPSERGLTIVGLPYDGDEPAAIYVRQTVDEILTKIRGAEPCKQ